MKITPLATAIHEAGHAIAMLVNPHAPTIREVSVRPCEGRLGKVHADYRFWPELANISIDGPPEAVESFRQNQRNAAWLDVVELLAGPVAEARHRFRSWDAVSLTGLDQCAQCFHGCPEEGSDLEGVRERLNFLHRQSAADHFGPAWEAAEQIVRAHWRAIVELGQMLRERECMTGDDLYAWFDQQLA